MSTESTPSTESTATAHIESVNEYISAAENYTAVISASWQAKFCYGSNSPEDVAAGKPVVPALYRLTDAKSRLNRCMAGLTPAMTPPTPTGTEAAVCADIARRQQLGLAKYGTTVAANPLAQRDWLQHAYEECLDLAIYLRRFLDGLPR